MTGTAGSFADLRLRVVSALVLALVGITAVWAGGLAFLILLSVISGLMIWELARMLVPAGQPVQLVLPALIASGAVFWAGYNAGPVSLLLLALTPLAGVALLSTNRLLFCLYAAVIILAVVNLYWLREGGGLAWAIWLVLVVIAADIGGYFFGRIFGGPKILPVISPKKTWSGTLGGLALAALVGFFFLVITTEGPSMVILSILAAAASQIGDIVESAIKRYTGIKDSSNLIPGHGGFLDRFDALIGASLFMLPAGYLIGLPLGGAV